MMCWWWLCSILVFAFVSLQDETRCNPTNSWFLWMTNVGYSEETELLEKEILRMTWILNNNVYGRKCSFSLSLSLNTFSFFLKHDFTCSSHTPLLHDSHMLVKRLKSSLSVASKGFQHITLHKSPALCKYSDHFIFCRCSVKVNIS